jgi:hypothetical protein
MGFVDDQTGKGLNPNGTLMHVMPHGPVGCGVEEDNHESREFGLNPVWCGWRNPLRVCVVCAWQLPDATGGRETWELNANGGTEVDEDRSCNG